MWVVVSLDGAALEDVDSPRLVVDACPSCRRRARLVERQVVRESDGLALPWRKRDPPRRVLQCSKCEACFALPEEGLPAWEERPEEREKSRRLADLRARWRIATQEVARWRKRSELAARGNDLALAEEARRMAARYEGEAHALRSEIERLGGELPQPPRPDPSEQRIDEELAALREKAAARKAARPGEAADAPPEAKPDEAAPASEEAPPAKPDEAPAGDAVDDELAALKRKVGRKEPAAPPTPGNGQKPAAPGEDEDELAALKRRLKNRN